uniref:CHK kinase-like domain-containing protein n=1 Tax=Panagrolaimus sp. JU765 TaxID=591449 RepID=A0AC34QZZ8_9BILA
MAEKIVKNVENLSLDETKKKILEPVNDLKKKLDEDCFDERQRLDGCSFTNGFLIESLRTNDQDFIEKYGKRPVKNITSTIVSKGKGFVSIILKCTVHFVDSSSDSDIYTTVLKVPGTESMDEAFGEIADFGKDFLHRLVKIHETEIKFYNEIALFCSDGVPIPKVNKTLPWIPGEQQGMIHMEDLSGCAKSINIMDSLNVRQVENIVSGLANLHKNGLINKSKMVLDNDKTFVIEMLQTFLPKVPLFIKSFLELANNDEFFTKMFSKYEKLILNVDFYIYASFDAWKDLKMEP